MNLNYNLFSVITISTSLLSVIIAIIILIKSGQNRRLHLPFVLFLYCSTVGLFDTGFLMHSGNYRIFPHLLSLTPLATFLMGPLLYVYLKNIFVGRSGIKNTIHFLPALLVFLFLIPFYLKSGNEKVFLFEEYLSGRLSFFDAFFYGTIGIFGLGHMLLYHLMSCVLLFRSKKAVLEIFSHLPQKIISWLGSVIWYLLIEDILLISTVLLSVFFLRDITFFSKALVIIVPISLIYISFKILFMPEFFFTASEFHFGVPVKIIEKYIPDPELVSILENLMKDKKLYKDMNLTLSDLARHTRIPRTALSLLINKHYKKNFYDFINRLRIDEVKRQIESSPTEINILQSALNSGFKSKTTFNACFKRYENMTPSEFRKMVQGEPLRTK